eukprot:scaffold50048_cov58-Phaeocystis_antarctica.AAC.3
MHAAPSRAPGAVGHLVWAFREAVDRHAGVDDREEQARVRGDGDEPVQPDHSAARAGRERRALGGQSEPEAQRHERAGEDRRWQANIGEEVRSGRGVTHRHVHHGDVAARQQERKERSDTTTEHERWRESREKECARCAGKFEKATKRRFL